MPDFQRIRLFFSLIMFIFSVSSQLWAQSPKEICNNGIDDNGNGLIDLNDPECDCPYISPIPHILNPSFENQDCCPFEPSKMDCASDWIQASETTPDYIDTCGFLGFLDTPVPLPIPDGNACVGFYNGVYQLGDFHPSWKEYVSTCLNIPFLAGVTYTFDFYVGFTKSPGNPPFKLSFYGTNDCENMPFGNGSLGFGCPSNDDKWGKLNDIWVEGNDEWVPRQIIFTPAYDIYALAIGPGCIMESHVSNVYYYLDNLQLADQTEFEFDIKIKGEPCSDQLALSVAKVDHFDYQWFKDGIAMIGETSSKLIGSLEEGIYQVMIKGDSIGCVVSQEYSHELPVSFGEISRAICQGESYSFNQIEITNPGIYHDTIKTLANCDSILSLHLSIVDGFQTSIKSKIFPGESYQIGNQHFRETGDYEVLLSSSAGCDSLVMLNLELYDIFIPSAFTPNDDGINDIFTLMGGDGLLWIKQMTVFNRWGKVVFQGNDFKGNDPNLGWNGWSPKGPEAEGVYVFTASLIYDDGQARTVSGSITLLR